MQPKHLTPGQAHSELGQDWHPVLAGETAHPNPHSKQLTPAFLLTTTQPQSSEKWPALRSEQQDTPPYRRDLEAVPLRGSCASSGWVGC